MPDYPLLDNLMDGYFNQDADLIAESDNIDGMINHYLRGTSQNLLKALSDEMDTFQIEHSSDLDKAFAERYPDDLDMSPVADFFDIFRERIQQKLQHE